VADKIVTDDRFFEVAVNGLYVVTGALVIGGIVWMAWGYVKSKVTFEGTT
jgi:hypothetical protein